MYLKPGDAIPRDLKQVFFYTVSPYQRGSANAVLNILQKGKLTEDDLDILRFLYENRTATLPLIAKRFPHLSEDMVQERLDALIPDRFVNRFMLADSTKKEPVFQNDSLAFYTIDWNTITLLSMIGDEEQAKNWSASKLMMSSDKVRKCLIAIEYKILIEKKLQSKTLSYHSFPVYVWDKRKTIIPYGEMIISDGNTRHSYIIEVFTHDDFFLGDATGISEKLLRYSEFAGTASSFYFSEEPILICLCDDIPTAQRAASLMNSMELKNCRVTTLELAEKDLETSLVRYDAEKGLVRTRNSFFR